MWLYVEQHKSNYCRRIDTNDNCTLYVVINWTLIHYVEWDTPFGITHTVTKTVTLWVKVMACQLHVCSVSTLGKLGHLQLVSSAFPGSDPHRLSSLKSFNGIENYIHWQRPLCEMICVRWIRKCNQTQSSTMLPWPYWIFLLLLQKYCLVLSLVQPGLFPTLLLPLHLIC